MVGNQEEGGLTSPEGRRGLHAGGKSGHEAVRFQGECELQSDAPSSERGLRLTEGLGGGRLPSSCSWLAPPTRRGFGSTNELQALEGSSEGHRVWSLQTAPHTTTPNRPRAVSAAPVPGALSRTPKACTAPPCSRQSNRPSLDKFSKVGRGENQCEGVSHDSALDAFRLEISTVWPTPAASFSYSGTHADTNTHAHTPTSRACTHHNRTTFQGKLAGMLTNSLLSLPSER